MIRRSIAQVDGSSDFRHGVGSSSILAGRARHIRQCRCFAARPTASGRDWFYPALGGACSPCCCCPSRMPVSREPRVVYLWLQYLALPSHRAKAALINPAEINRSASRSAGRHPDAGPEFGVLWCLDSNPVILTRGHRRGSNRQAHNQNEMMLAPGDHDLRQQQGPRRPTVLKRQP
jgi:hypothetical protein